jgi:hypothetical protein
MITFLLAFTGAMIGGIFINYVLNANNPNWEEPIYGDKRENYDD